MTLGTFILIIIAALGIALGYFASRHGTRDRLLNSVNDERHIEKERRKRMLIKHLKDRKKMTAEQASDLLGVEHSTIMRYFDELEDSGAVVQRGEAGRSVYYELVTTDLK